MPRGTGAKSSGGNGRRGPDKIKRKRSCFRRPSKSASAAENPNPFTARNVSAGNEESSSSSPSSLPPQPSPSPASSPSPSDARHTFVKEYLHTLIKELKEQLRQEKGALYDHLKRGHTTIEPVNPVIACFTSGLNPEHFWKPALRCWLPKLWFPELDLKCPKCHQFGKHHKHGYASNPEARCVAGLRNDWYLFTSVLQCAFCRHRFYATHPDVLGNMHQAFSNPILLPFVLSESSGLDSDVAWMMPIIFNDGGTAESLHRMMSEGHAEQRDLLHAVYNAVCDFRLKKSVGLPDPPKFDRSQVDVSVPAASSLLSIYKRETLRYEKYMNLHMLTLSAESAKLDASHKMPKLICNVNGQRIFDTAVQVTNERSQIVALVLNMLFRQLSLKVLPPCHDYTTTR
ncbi:unnamed protein product (mitochondrion) [Plasmodiophora brassicae]|uniref:DUF6729 domain-containing protein n=1 Tax=Plasmodiophora brassicae TaxID=37360 RepID=A0A3P3YA42_PLABS|nr:unnamed protein product [Plasmodiophora brassicae]